MKDLKSATSVLKSGKLYATFLFPYMVAFKSLERRWPSESLCAAFEQLGTELAPHQQTDLNDLATIFRFGGLRSPLI